MSELDIFERAIELRRASQPFALAIIVRAEKPTSAKPGDRAIVTQDGRLEGWVGGACAQRTVIAQGLATLRDRQPRLLRLSVEAAESPSGRIDLPMTCFSGGLLEIYIQPELPPPRLVIVGHSPIGRALSTLGGAMGYEVRALGAGALPGEADAGADELEALGAAMGPETYVVVTTSGHHDEAALDAVLRRTEPRYIGVVSSRTRFASVRDHLRATGHDEAALGRIKAPAGLDIGARLPEEIALSILSEIVERRRRAQAEQDAEADPATTTSEHGGGAIDPICGMEVQREGAAHVHEHAGQRYYFCCAGCKRRFAADPAAHLQQATPQGEARDPICGMGVDIEKARHMSEYEGQLFYFCCNGCKTRFEAAPAKFVHAGSAARSG
ncbi:MAG: YHS domain-containing protein [Myxococcales bacterium]|nr:YHS domain-containing protein [Myxococcales bacterium]